jgi:hypothetical protein
METCPNTVLQAQLNAGVSYEAVRFSPKLTEKNWQFQGHPANEKQNGHSQLKTTQLTDKLQRKISDGGITQNKHWSTNHDGYTSTIYHLFISSIIIYVKRHLPQGRQQSNTMPTWATSVKKQISRPYPSLVLTGNTLRRYL